MTDGAAVEQKVSVTGTGVGPQVSWGAKFKAEAFRALEDPLMWGGAVAGFLAGVVLGWGWKKLLKVR